MEGKKKIGFSYAVLVIILFAAVCFLTDYILIDRKLNENKGSVNNTSTSENSNNNVNNSSSGSENIIDDSVNSNVYSYNLGRRQSVQQIYDEYFGLLVDLDGNVYMTVDNLNYVENEETKNSLLSIKQQYSTYSPNGYTNFDGDSTLDAYKLDLTGVLFVHQLYIGNGGLQYFVFVLENGKLAYISYDSILNSNGKVDIYNVDNIAGIISIVPENIYSYAIDINGNEYLLGDYIENNI